MDPVASVYDCVGSTCAKGDMYVPSKWGYVPCSVLAHQTDPNPDLQEQIKGGGWALAACGSSKIWLWSIEFRPWNTQVKTEQCQCLASNRLTRLHKSASLLADRLSQRPKNQAQRALHPSWLCPPGWAQSAGHTLGLVLARPSHESETWTPFGVESAHTSMNSGVWC